MPRVRYMIKYCRIYEYSYYYISFIWFCQYKRRVFLCSFICFNYNFVTFLVILLHLFQNTAIAERESNRIARRRCIFASSGALLLARLVSCFAKSHQNLSKMHSPAGASSFDTADFFESKSFSRRAYRQYVQGER